MFDNPLESVVAGELAAFTAALASSRQRNIGFPAATDLDFQPLAGLLSGYLLNNMGDPWVDGVWLHHTKHWEREVVRSVAELLRAPADNWWGYVTTGGSEGNLYGLHLARS